MFYEDVVFGRSDTISSLALVYGHSDWRKIWNDARNLNLKTHRGAPAGLQAGDMLMIPIPWKIVRQTLNVELHGVGYEAKHGGTVAEAANKQPIDAERARRVTGGIESEIR